MERAAVDHLVENTYFKSRSIPDDSDLLYDSQYVGAVDISDPTSAPLSTEGLAVATAVDDIDDNKKDGPVTFAQEVDLSTKIPLHKTKQFWIFAALSLLVIAAITSGIVIGGAKLEVENKKITNAPSIAFSSAPSTMRDGLGIWQALNLMTDIDLILGLETGSNDEVKREQVSKVRESPQFRAADWIINHDNRTLDAEDPDLDQRYALSVLYFATRGEFWWIGDNNGTFLTEEHECEWYGIICDTEIPGFSTKVRKIDLRLEGLGGTFPKEIALLSTVDELNFDSNFMGGTLPEEVGELKGLVTLSFSDNFFTGTIPESYYSLVELDTFQFYWNLLTGTISNSIEKLINLKTILLFENFFSGTLPKSIGDLTQLRDIDVDTNEFTGSVPEFLHPKLVSIKLYLNFFEGTLSQNFKNLVRLEQIDLDDNMISGSIPEDLFSLKHMQEIRLSNNLFTGTLSTRVGQLSQLQYLDLSSNLLTGTLPEELGEAVSSIQILVRNNEFTGSIPASMGNLVSLRRFWFHYNSLISGEIPQELCDLTYEYNLTEMSSDCLDFYNDPTFICECCEECCDPIERKCVRVLFF